MKQDNSNPAVIHKDSVPQGCVYTWRAEERNRCIQLSVHSKQTPQVDDTVPSRLQPGGAGSQRDYLALGEPEPLALGGAGGFPLHIRSETDYACRCRHAPWSLGVVVEWQGCSGCSRGDSEGPRHQGQ